MLQSLQPARALNPLFKEVIALGTGRVFDDSHNDAWMANTLPITTAFFHARFMLEMAVRCARFETAPQLMDSDLAALLYLYNLR